MTLLDLFRDSPEKKAAKQNEERLSRIKAEQDNSIYEALRQVLAFPGTKEQFEEFVGYECFVIDARKIDPQRRDAGLVFRPGSTYPFNQYDSVFRERLVEQGIVGLVNAVPFSYFRLGDDQARYGLPVGKK